MEILAWNIRHEGGRRNPKIVEVVRAHNPDLIFLSEYRVRTHPDDLSSQLSGLGYIGQYATVVERQLNGILAASREPLAHPRQFPDLRVHQHRVLELRLSGVSVLACYFPQGAVKIPVFEFLIDWAAQRVQTPALIIGEQIHPARTAQQRGATWENVVLEPTFRWPSSDR
jgi:exonuclease III